MSELTIREAQKNQPWTVPYSFGVQQTTRVGLVPHILASHTVLHAAKSVGKLAAVYESLDHTDTSPTREHEATVRAMAADLMTAALRLANLHGFDLSDALEERVMEKNGAGFRTPEGEGGR